jgi:hypothetical protein
LVLAWVVGAAQAYLGDEPMTSLLKYPQEIAQVHRCILRLDRRARKVRQALDRKTAQIEQAIAVDPDLKNDQQRKAKRFELSEADDYRVLVETVADYQDRRTQLEIQLQLLRDEFSVLKLQYRDAIASKELSVA